MDGLRSQFCAMQPGTNTDRFLATLERLLAIPSAELDTALTHACNAVADALHADKVDAFVYDESRDSLVAMGTSTQPLSSLQKKLGLDVLPISNGGRVVYVYKTGKTFLTGHLDEDEEELRGVRFGLKIKSKLGVPLDVGGRRHGMMMVASLQPEFFRGADAIFAEAVARWVAMIAERAELVQEITRNAVEQGRRAVAEELITVLAHDLRNYLSPIAARLQLLRNRALRDHRDDDLREVQKALGGVDRLGRLISDLLDVARLDQGIFQMDVQPTDLASIAREIAKTLSTPDHQVNVAASEETIVAADARRVQQCVENLIANAVQHSPHAAAVNITVSMDRKDERSWGLLTVHNEGPGIPVELLARVFDRFTAGPGSTGLGLGLYLARRIAVAHGGELTVESQPGKGARFVLRLPCYQQ
jgi:two-component system, OmpR family, sensor kinase